MLALSYIGGMRTAKPKPLGEILTSVIASMGMDSRLAQGQIVAAWEDILSEQMKSVIESSWMSKDKLFVRVTSPAWRQELHLRRKEWCDRLNAEMGRDAVSEVIFR